MGSASATEAPHQAFICQDQKYIAVGVVKEEQWPPLCRALKLEQLTSDPRFCTNSARVEHRAELVPHLAQRFKAKPAAWWIIALSREKLPHLLFLSFDVLRFHPQVRANGYLVEMDTSALGQGFRADGLPWKFDATPAVRFGPGQRDAR